MEELRVEPRAGAAPGPSHDGVRTREHTATICGVPTRFVLSAYSNRTLVLVTQTSGMGTLVRRRPPWSRARALLTCPLRAQIHAQADNSINASSGTYTTRVLLGRRDDEVLEVYARTLVELIGKKSPESRPLLLSISIKEHSKELFREVMRIVVEQWP